LEKRKIGKENLYGAWRLNIEFTPCAPQYSPKKSMAEKTSMGHGASALNLHPAQCRSFFKNGIKINKINS